MNTNWKSVVAIATLQLMVSCSSVKWQTVDTPLSQSGLAELPLMLTQQTADDSHRHEYPGLAVQQLWRAALVVLSQEAVVVAVDPAAGTLIAMLDGATPPVRLTVATNDTGSPTVVLDWFRSAYAIDAASYSAIEVDQQPRSTTPEWKDLDKTSANLLERIATQAYLQHSWRFLPSAASGG